MVPIFKPYMPDNLSEINTILYSGALGYGDWTKAFEKQLKEYLGVKNILTTNSYNSALLVLLTALDLKAGDEVIASPMSCLASNQPFLNRGLKVKWIDIDLHTGTIDPTLLKEGISSETKAIFHNHHCGIPGHIDEINQIGKDNGVYVVDDCIEAFGSEYKGKIIGNSGADAAIYSFQTVRLPNTIDGGAVTFYDAELNEKAKFIRDYGINRNRFRDENNEINSSYNIESEGYGAMMSDLNGYIGHQQMLDIDRLLRIQRENAKNWITSLNGYDVEILGMRDNINPNFWVFNMLTNNKQEMLKHFRKLGFYASGIHVNNDIYSIFGNQGKFERAQSFNKKHLALPCGWWFNKDKNNLLFK